MQYNAESAAIVLAEVKNALNAEGDDAYKVARAWHALAILRANVLAVLLKNTIGSNVYSGPFKDMKLTPAALQKAFGPVLIGCYEHELHKVVEHIIARRYKRILNIGCAFGYYATGFALRMPEVTILAYDILDAAQKQCKEMAVLNGVQSRVHVSGLFRGDDFATYADGETLVLMDIEGAEVNLLDPDLYPALKKMDILVELHDLYNPGISKTVMSRFVATHNVDFIINKATTFDFEPLTGKAYNDPFDSSIIAWENRDGPTPWAFMQVK